MHDNFAAPEIAGLPRGAMVLLLGGTDTGKTTWVQNTALAWNREGKTVGIVDCDLGQSEIGPPATISAALAVPEQPWRSLRDLTPIGGYFIGATSPSRHILEVCTGAVQMARIIRKRRPDLILIDTDGFITGQAGNSYKQHLTELLLPQVIIALSRGEELTPIFRAFASRETPHIYHTSIPDAVKRKTTTTRTTRRMARFQAALQNSQPLTFSLDAITLMGTALGLGPPLPHHLRQFLSQSLRRQVIHAEHSVHGLYIITHGEGWDSTSLAAVESHFATRSVTIVAAQKFAHLLVGLSGPSGTFLGLGRIERIDFARRTLTLDTPCRKPRAVSLITLGSLRLNADRKELGEVRPGEI